MYLPYKKRALTDSFLSYGFFQIYCCVSQSVNNIDFPPSCISYTFSSKNRFCKRARSLSAAVLTPILKMRFWLLIV